MKARRSLIIFLAIVFVFSFLSVTAQAEIHKFYFNVWTTSYPGQPLQVGFYFEIADTNLRVPDAISSLKIQAPDGTVFDLSTNYWKYWEEWYQDLFIWKYATDFKTQTIPSGTYKATVVDKSTPAKTLVNSDSLTAAAVVPLPVATITNPPPVTPPNPPPILPLEPTLTWSRVTGAQFYRIYLFDESRKEEVYGVSRVGSQFLHVYTNSFKIPKGVLMPNHTYSLRIDARDNDKNLSRRSRTNWATFKTAP
jgi:hypothetical protein